VGCKSFLNCDNDMLFVTFFSQKIKKVFFYKKRKVQEKFIRFIYFLFFTCFLNITLNFSFNLNNLFSKLLCILSENNNTNNKLFD
jgi:hypothetical protein